MKIKEVNENVTRIYEVEIDKSRLKEIIRSLDELCYVRRVEKKIIEAKDEIEAENKIKDMRNYAGLIVNDSFRVGRAREHQGWYHGMPYEVPYETVCKESVQLVKILKTLLDYQEMNIEAIDDDTKKINELRNYHDSYDFLPFEKRVEMAKEKVDTAIANNSKDLLNELKEYANIVIEAKLNEEYDFETLNRLYCNALNCFKYVLVEETTKYNKTR